MSREVTNVEELLTALEAKTKEKEAETMEKKLDVLHVLEDLIIIYQLKGDEQSLKRGNGKGVFDPTNIESIDDQ